MDVESKEASAHLETINTHATYIDDEGAVSLSQEHRKYLFHRHGSLDLDPIPGFGDADPYNWPTWKKTLNLLLVAFHACMSTFTAAAIIPAYENIAIDFGQSVQKISYLTSLQIAILGGAPLFWKPLSTRFGRRPIFLVSLICSLICNIGCANSPTYATMGLCRALTAFFISPAAAIGSAVVTESYFKKERARYMGIWTLMVTIGVPLSPFIFGFVAVRASYRWIYYILAMINFVQFFLYLIFGPETRYICKGVFHEGSSLKQQYMTVKRIDPTPFTAKEFIEPLFLVRHASAIIPATAYSMVFLFASVLITVEIPQLFAAKFGFNAQQLGLQFIAIIVGSVLGEQVSGFLSDSWMKRESRRIGRPAKPEFRLWLSYLGIVLSIVGVVVFLIQIDNAPAGQWNITPLIGAAIGAGGNQIVTTILITYIVDTRPNEAANVGVFVTFVRQLLGFLGPFWFPQIFADIGLKASAGVTTALLVGVSLLPVMLLQVLRTKQK